MEAEKISMHNLYVKTIETDCMLMHVSFEITLNKVELLDHGIKISRKIIHVDYYVIYGKIIPIDGALGP